MDVKTKTLQDLCVVFYVVVFVYVVVVVFIAKLSPSSSTAGLS